MNALRGIYEFVTGGSIVAPIGLAAAMVLTYACLTRGVSGPVAGAALIASLALVFVGSALERAR